MNKYALKQKNLEICIYMQKKISKLALFQYKMYLFLTLFFFVIVQNKYTNATSSLP